jgi:hypothetical protein
LLDDELQTNSVWTTAGTFLAPPYLRQKWDTGGNPGQAKLAAHQVGEFQRLFCANTNAPCADIFGFAAQYPRAQPRLIGFGELSYLQLSGKAKSCVQALWPPFS